MLRKKTLFLKMHKYQDTLQKKVGDQNGSRTGSLVFFSFLKVADPVSIPHLFSSSKVFAVQFLEGVVCKMFVIREKKVVNGREGFRKC